MAGFRDAVGNHMTTVATHTFIANSDFGWFSHSLNRAEPPDEADFWQPSPHGFRAIPPVERIS